MAAVHVADVIPVHQKVFKLAFPNLFAGCCGTREPPPRMTPRKASIENFMEFANVDTIKSLEDESSRNGGQKRQSNGLQVLTVQADVVDDENLQVECRHCQKTLVHDRNVYMAYDLRFCSEKCRNAGIHTTRDPYRRPAV